MLDQDLLDWTSANYEAIAVSSHVTMQEAWDQFEDDDFVQFNIDWLSQVLRVVKPNGNILVFGTMHNKAAETEHAEKCRALRRSRSSPTHNLHQLPRLDRRRAAPLRRSRPTHGDPRVVPTSAAPGGQAFVQSVQPGKDATLGEGALTKASAQRALTQALHQRDTGSAWKSGSVSQRCACRREMSAASAACVQLPQRATAARNAACRASVLPVPRRPVTLTDVSKGGCKLKTVFETVYEPSRAVHGFATGRDLEAIAASAAFRYRTTPIPASPTSRHSPSSTASAPDRQTRRPVEGDPRNERGTGRDASGPGSEPSDPGPGWRLPDGPGAAGFRILLLASAAGDRTRRRADLRHDEVGCGRPVRGTAVGRPRRPPPRTRLRLARPVGVQNSIRS